MVTILKSLCCDFFFKENCFADLQRDTRKDINLAVSNLWLNKQGIRWNEYCQKKILPNSPGNLEMQENKYASVKMVCL